MNENSRTNHFSWLVLGLLILGGFCAAFGQGRWTVPILAWFAPILLIRFVRDVPGWVAILGFTIIHAVAWEVAYMGMVKMPTFARWGLFLGLSVVLGLVYLVDRHVANRSCRFWSTLVFPCGWVTLEYLNGRFSPSGSWSSIAYTFTDQINIVQVASLVGWTGVSFLVAWVASVVNWSWDRQRAGQPMRTGVLTCVGVLTGVLVFGGVRSWMPPSSETIRVASIVGPSPFLDGSEFRNDVWSYTRGVNIPEQKVASARQKIQETIDRHIELAERELRAGAKIVSFPEANPAITKNEEAAFVAAAGQLAMKYEAYVGLGLFVFRPQAGLPAENKFILVGPNGEVVWDFLKAKLVPGSSHVVGDGVLPIAETDFGEISCAICFDMDFPHLLKQAGENGVDVFLAPSNDWPEVRAIHAKMATMRAIEQGFNLLRPTKDGISLATDALGRTIAWQDTARPGEHVLVAEIPTTGRITVYSVIGDFFAWCCIAVFSGLVFIAYARLPSAAKGQPENQ